MENLDVTFTLIYKHFGLAHHFFIVINYKKRYILTDMPIPLPICTARSGWAFFFLGYE